MQIRLRWWITNWMLGEMYLWKIHWQFVVQSKVMFIILLFIYFSGITFLFAVKEIIYLGYVYFIYSFSHRDIHTIEGFWCYLVSVIFLITSDIC